ncbi:hypothetical protein SAMN04487848_0940 [Microbacterium sp. ru370.1]|uniref:hypothetical protein n=1 Tax=unclassified Microbacterium TaxID=2609290 RepID=UPI000881BFA9|nr:MULTISPECIES: hypothetical protein [unclassified Microbacterium]SDO44753.1 hypothetical protein SAMN04487848_0940 [Microbacterium sp. ru370.1]SIT81090.1 hypothetical protein SAMN05880579_0936 [Microbacterium sp. RU1D]
MSDAPAEPNRRSRREARATSESSTAPDVFAEFDDRSGDAATRPFDASDRRAGGVEAAADRPRTPAPARSGPAVPRERTASGFVGTWKPLAAAVGALAVAVTVGLLASVAFDGATGRSVGSVLAALLLGATGMSLMARTRLVGFFSLRGLDVLWALVAGAVLPFVTGVFASNLGFPALAALSPRWLLLGVVAPFVVVLGLTFFAIAFVYPAAESFAATFLSPVWSRVVAGAVSAVAFAIVPLVFSVTVSGMPRALLIGLGIAASVFVALSRRVWGPVLMGMVFTGVWVAMSVAGYVLA